jgi:hypothetical protein
VFLVTNCSTPPLNTFSPSQSQKELLPPDQLYLQYSRQRASVRLYGSAYTASRLRDPRDATTRSISDSPSPTQHAPKSHRPRDHLHQHLQLPLGKRLRVPIWPLLHLQTRRRGIQLRRNQSRSRQRSRPRSTTPSPVLLLHTVQSPRPLPSLPFT